MRFFVRALLVVTATVVSPQVFAGDEEGFVGFDLGRVNLDFDGADELSPNMLRGRVGIYIMDEPRISLQSQLAYNLNGSEVKTDHFCDYVDLGCDTAFNLTYFVGLYLGIELPIGTDYYAYAHAGYASGQISGTTVNSDGAFILESTQSSPSYALGFAFALPYNMHGYFEYGNWLDAESLSFSGFSLGVRFPIARDDR